MSKFLTAAALAATLTLGAGLAMANTADTPKPEPTNQQVFEQECGLCHGKVGTGTMMLARRMDKDKAELARRDDLPAAYIEYAVRNGLNSMPAISRVEVTDQQLEQITTYLTRNNK